MKRIASNMSHIVMAAFLTLAALSQGTQTLSAQTSGAHSIVYFNVSRVINEYQYSKEVLSDLKTQSDQIEATIAQKTRYLENDISDFQSKLAAEIYTQSQAQQRSSALQRRQDELQSYTQQKRAEIKQKSDAVNNEVMALIQDYVTRFNASRHYSMILATQVVGGLENYVLCLPVVAAEKSLDITDTIIAGMNAEYAQRKDAQAK